MLKNLWMDEGGAVLSFELLLLLVITVIGVSVGMVVLRDAVVSEFQWAAAAVNALDPGYAWSALVYTGNNSSAMVNGSNANQAALGIGIGTGLLTNDVIGDLTINSDTPEDNPITASP